LNLKETQMARNSRL